jgi:fucose permease
VGNAITVSFIGMLLGPMYPIAMNRAARVLPPWILTGAIGWIGALGQAGSAIVPFMTGAIAEKHSIKSLHPLYVFHHANWYRHMNVHSHIVLAGWSQ